MKEKWIQINTIYGYEDIKDCYWISNSDKDWIVNKDTMKQLKPWINNKGYKTVKLMTIDGKKKMCKIHVLKAKAFLFGPIPLSASVVRHLNDVKTDNRLTNLAWGTRSDNTQDAIKNGRFNYEAAVRGLIKGNAKIAKKYSKPVKCLETGMIYPSAREASRQMNVPLGSISLCCNGKRKTAGGFHFEYADQRS